MMERRGLHCGVVNRKSGLLSGLVLAPPPGAEEKYETLLGQDIVNMRLSARMAVLSACQTGQGQPNGNDGILGLAWAFQAAGCPSVVASLWSVDDVTTKDLMVAFYKQLKAGKPKDEALRTAMLGVMRDGNGHESPFYWAAFQVIGDTSPLRLEGVGANRHSPN